MLVHRSRSGTEGDFVIVAVEFDNAVSVGATVGHGGVGDSALIWSTAPPASADGCMVEVVMILGAEPIVTLEVGVGGQGEGVLVVFDHFEEFFLVGNSTEGDVHAQDDELVDGYMFEVVAEPGELLVSEFAGVATFFAAIVFDVVKDHKVDWAEVETVVTGAVNALPGFRAQIVVGGIEIEVVIAEDVVPREADIGDGLIERLIKLKIVEHDVAEADSEFAVLVGGVTDDLLDDVVRHVVDFGLVSGLGIAEHHDSELIGLGFWGESEINCARKRAGGLDAFVLCGRRSVGLVDVKELGDLVCGDGGFEPPGLDDMDNRVFGDGELIFAIPVGFGDSYAVADADVWEGLSGFRVGDSALCGLGLGRKGEIDFSECEAADEGGGSGEEVASEHGAGFTWREC